MKIKLIILSLLMNTAIIQAQEWRIGISGGTSYNHLTQDRQSWTVMKNENQWGMGDIGFWGQYNFNPWLGVRADINWTQKFSKRKVSSKELRVFENIRPNFLQLPVMASLSFGNNKLRGFGNIGLFGGYRINNINTAQEHRLEFGYVSGVGCEFRLCRHWSAQVEARYYYSVVSTTKDYMRHLKNPHYNNTLTIHSSLCWIF